MQFVFFRFLAIAFVVSCHVQQEHALNLQEERARHVVKTMDDNEIMALAQSSNMSHFESVLDAILIPRVVGTPNHDRVKNFLRNSMKSLGWKVVGDKFSAQTPIFGNLQFENIVATLNPNARRFLILACHYDSKYFREGDFMGATDSAVPCAMMINLAHTMKDQLNTIKNQNRLSLKLIFFDGEEAFRHWSSFDSIYGSRHLAAKWERTPHPKNNRDGTSLIHSIDMLVLLDLLGAPDPIFHSYFGNTDKWYRMLVKSESKLAGMKLLKRYSIGKPEQTYFQPLSANGGIEDDHIPFLQRGVPILHIIPHPFPDVWHTARDNRDAIDMSTVENLLKIFRVFIASYMGLSVSI